MAGPRKLIAWDLDGTLIRPREGAGATEADYDDEAAIYAHREPHPERCAIARALVEAGHPIAYVTGRGPHLRKATAQQIRDAGLPDGPVFMFPHPRGAFPGLDQMAAWKATVLRWLNDFSGVETYVGDMPQDREAAHLAGVRFVPDTDAETLLALVEVIA